MEPGKFALTSLGESARLWFPWHTQASFEGNEADWLSPSAGNGSQIAPGGWTPDIPVNQWEGEEEEELRVGGNRKKRRLPLLIKTCLQDHSFRKYYIRELQERRKGKRTCQSDLNTLHLLSAKNPP